MSTNGADPTPSQPAAPVATTPKNNPTAAPAAPANPTAQPQQQPKSDGQKPPNGSTPPQPPQNEQKAQAMAILYIVGLWTVLFGITIPIILSLNAIYDRDPTYYGRGTFLGEYPKMNMEPSPARAFKSNSMHIVFNPQDQLSFHCFLGRLRDVLMTGYAVAENSSTVVGNSTNTLLISGDERSDESAQVMAENAETSTMNTESRLYSLSENLTKSEGSTASDGTSTQPSNDSSFKTQNSQSQVEDNPVTENGTDVTSEVGSSASRSKRDADDESNPKLVASNEPPSHKHSPIDIYDSDEELGFGQCAIAPSGLVVSHGFGFPENRPCLILRLNRLLGFVPQTTSVNASNPSNEAKKRIDKLCKNKEECCHRERLRFDCKANRTDVQFDIYPRLGISSCFFPYTYGQRHFYVTPFAMLQIHNLSKEAVEFECFAVSAELASDDTNAIHFVASLTDEIVDRGSPLIERAMHCETPPPTMSAPSQ